MNPRYRRLLIPGLLTALIVVVVVASLGREADAAEPAAPASAQVVSRIDDPRLTESSGLAVSARFTDLAYTINDSGNADSVYAVRISTGEVVGETRVQGTAWVDTEALALDADGTLWVADVGDNDGVRDDLALYALAEPGEGDGTAEAERYPVSYDGGPRDVESLAIDPRDGRKVLVTKELLSGRVLQLPAELSTQGPNVPDELDWSTLLLATDASFTPDAGQVVVRNYVSAAVHDATTGELLRTETLPEQEQGETLAVEPSGESYLVGSEGSGSELWRVGLDAESAGAPVPQRTPDVDEAAADFEPEGVGRPWLSSLVGFVAVAFLAGVSVWMMRGPRTKGRKW